jgi:hypothetical protein
MTILFQLKPDRSLDSQMNTKQQANVYHLRGNSVYISVCWWLVSFTPPLVYSKTGIFVAMYLCTRGIDLPFFYGFYTTVVYYGEVKLYFYEMTMISTLY